MAQVTSHEATLSGSKRSRSSEQALVHSPASKRRRNDKQSSNSSLSLPCSNDNISYEDYVVNNMTSLKDDPSINDVTFIVEGEELYGIRALFATQSAVFKRMLYGNMIESIDGNHVILNDITIAAFKYLRSTFYNIFDKDDENENNDSKLTCYIVVDVLFAAQKYIILPLITKCINFIKKIKNINDWYFVLNKFEKSQFQYQSKIYLSQIINENEPPYVLQYKSVKFLQNNKFKYLKPDTIIILINSDFLAAKEDQIWDSLLKWTRINAKLMLNNNGKQSQYISEEKEHNKLHFDDRKDTEKEEEEEEEDKEEKKCLDLSEEEKKCLSKFIKYIRFNQMDGEYLKKEIVDKNILPQCDIINIMFARENGKKWKSSFNDKQRIKSKLMDIFELNEVCLTLSEIKLLKIGDLVDFRDYYGLFCTASIIDCDHNSNRIKIHYNNWGSTYDEWWHYLSSSSETTSNSRSILNPTRSNNNNEDEEELASDNDENNDENDDNDNSEIITLSQSDKNHRIARYGSITSRGIKRQCLKYQAEEFQKNMVETNSNNNSIKVNELQVKLPMAFWKKNENYIDDKKLFINKWLNAKIVSYKTAAKYSHHIKIGVYVNEDHYEYWVHPDNNDECRPLQN